MKLHTINTGFFKLDGGAMHGVVPKSLWNKHNPSDENNMCTWAMRCLLVEYGDKLVLIDNGIGTKQDEKFFGHYYLHGGVSLESSLREKGFSLDDVTDVFLTHLHFDHCGGSIRREGDLLVPNFRNATFWSNAEHWEWATKPNPREKASFLKENILPIKESGQLKFATNGQELFPDFKLWFTYGHTGAMMLPHITCAGKTVVFMADLMPSVAHIPMPWVMAYDTQPLETMREKAAFLQKAADENFVLFFEHDAYNECCTVEQSEKGIRLKDKFALNELFV